MKESDLEDIISKGKTKAYSFKSKAGKTFKAKLVLNKDTKKNDFEFVNSSSSSSGSKGTSKKTSTSSSKSSSGWSKKPLLILRGAKSKV